MIKKTTVEGTYVDVLQSLRPVGPLTGFLLWFRPWHPVKVPDDWPCEIVQTYQYKELFGNAYNLSMMPSPVFPNRPRP